MKQRSPLVVASRDINSTAVDAHRLSRRDTLKGSVAAVAVATTTQIHAQEQPSGDRLAPLPVNGKRIAISASINGRQVEAEIDTRTSLLDFLRERQGLTGTKKGCDHGQCGACTLHLDGRRVLSCLMLAAKIDGRSVTTIEGIAEGDELHPMQQAFIDHDALQCGYCTPGQIMAAIACIREGNATSRESIRETMSGNICRCGAYVGIVAAIEDVVRFGRL
jgi:xanthine dehydrogenase YagT iron-sulfur-binding subunit